MIKNVSDKIFNISVSPYLSYGGSDTYANNIFKREKVEHSQPNNQTNPFDKVEIENKVQKYFNEKYVKIRSNVKNIIFSLSDKGDIKTRIDSSVIEAKALIARYNYNGSLPSTQDKKYSVYSDKDNSYMECNSIYGDLISRTTFNGINIEKINLFEGENEYEINFKKKNILEKLINSDKTTVKSYKMKNKNGNTVENVEFSQNGDVEEYSLYDNENNLKYQLQFDLNNPQTEISNKKIIPQKYTSFNKNNEKLETLTYQYGIPVEYKEYNPKNNKTIKMFNIQGVNSLVHKYSFYNEETGALVISGQPV